jgi:UDP-N-acetylmuramate dehydrogenase
MLSQEMISEVSDELLRAGCDVRSNFPLGPLTTYAVGGSATLAVVVSDISSSNALAALLAKFPDLPLAIVGRGSNTLVSDDGFNGLAIVMSSAPRDVELAADDDIVTAYGSMTMPVLARRSVAAGRAGLEWCVGIPGSVGGAVRMNAGGHGAEMRDSLVSVRIVSLKSGKSVDVNVDDVGLHFRGSALAGHHLVVNASFRTSHTSVEEGTRVIDDVVRWRRQHQPGGRNAGSVFVNPSPGSGSAGALIDALGLRGYQSGGAIVSEKHANFIQADSSTTAQDIIDVMSHVQSTVEKAHAITLRSEVCLLGFSSEIVDRFADPTHHEASKVQAREHLSRLLGESL